MSLFIEAGLRSAWQRNIYRVNRTERQHKHSKTESYFHPVVTIGMEAGARGKSPMMPQLFMLGIVMTVYTA